MTETMAQSPAETGAVSHAGVPAVTLATPVCTFEDFLGATAADRLLDDACRAQLEHLAAERGQDAQIPSRWASSERVLRAPGLAEAVRSMSAVAQDMLGIAAPAGRMGYGSITRNHQPGESPEAIVARDADTLECLVQAVEYREQRYSLTQNWIDTSLASLKTPSAKALADAALSKDSLQWQKKLLP